MSKVLVLRTCNDDGTSRNSFVWPLTVGSTVTCPDWDSKPECGNGLHGLLWGEGNGELLSWEEDDKWLVLEVEESDIIDLGGKVKFPSCKVVHVGDQKSATNYMYEHSKLKAIVGLMIQVGNSSTILSGYGSKITSGEGSKITSGEGSKITSGDYNTITSGDYSTITSGNYSTITSGNRSTITSENGSKVKAGKGSMISISYWDDSKNRSRLVTAYVGEDGIEANVFYSLKVEYKFEKVEE